ncbi:MAG: lysoplasmalogenase [Deltaproteobacteria bacterium]|nr:lysoplasmalogenase [Deltaproteobacteria bacterium]
MIRVLFLLGLVTGAGYLLVPDDANTLLRVSLKAAPVLCLAAALLLRGGRGAPTRLILVGLGLSAVGDVLLSLPGEGYFLPGLVAFLLAHLGYIAAFLWHERRLAPLRLLPFLTWGAVAALVLGPKLGEMLVPVIVYLCVIQTMMWRAAARDLSLPAARLALIGALTFGVSDSVLAFDLFHTPFGAADLIVMLTYWAGQLGITASAMQAAAPQR